MSYGPQYTGSDNCELAGQYIYGGFQNMGLDVIRHEWRFGGSCSQ